MTIIRSYLRPGFPTFSCTYSLYCDHELAHQEHALWLADKTYRGYLAFYKSDPLRIFPEHAEVIIAEWVADNEPAPTGLLAPTREQCWEFMPFLIDELSGQPPEAPNPTPPPPSVDRTPVSPSAERPLLSCLACIFLNNDQRFFTDTEAFLCDFGLRDESVKTLRAFAQNGSGFLTRGQAMALSPALVDEFVKMPAVW